MRHGPRARTDECQKEERETNGGYRKSGPESYKRGVRQLYHWIETMFREDDNHGLNHLDRLPFPPAVPSSLSNPRL